LNISANIEHLCFYFRHFAKLQTVSGHCKTTTQTDRKIENMDIAILIANILTLLAFILHTFVGDKELKKQPLTSVWQYGGRSASMKHLCKVQQQ
jgi:hypothetical protein